MDNSIKRKLRIACDMDGIAVDFIGKLIARYNADHDANFTKADITQWDLHKLFPIGHLIYKYFDEPGFFADDIPEIPGALESVQWMLAEGHDVFFVSAASGGVCSDKAKWVAQYAPYMLNRMFLSHGKTPKEHIEADVLIDDGPHNIKGYRLARPSAYITGIEYPYTAPGVPYANVLYPYTDTVAAWKNICRDIDLLARGASFRDPNLAVEDTVVS